ncbi:MAG: hypothetical protein ACREMP_07730 [Candidatus Tyrphobacter sp.]
MSIDAASLIDAHLLDAGSSRGDLVAELLVLGPASDAVRPFYEGMRMLGARTPDLALIALRLAIAGRARDDAAVVRMRDIIARARAGEAGAREEYAALLR